MSLPINDGSYYAYWPWRASGASALGFLRGVLESEEQGAGNKQLAWRALLETRNAEAVGAALSLADRVSLYAEPSVYLLEVGLEMTGGQLQALHTNAPLHLCFDAGYFEQTRPIWQTTHPTWHLAALAESSTLLIFGGDTTPAGTLGSCAACGGGLRHLITLCPLSEAVGVTGLSSLSLAACLSCLGGEQEALFYQHDESGMPTQIGYSGRTVVPQFPAGPLKATQVRLIQAPARWRWQDWALSNARENLHRVGGNPCWIQSADYRTCLRCGRTMHFLMHLDSDLSTADGGEWLWGSGGIGYVLWCDACKVSGVLCQYT